MKLLRFAPIFLVLAVSPASSVESFDLQPHTLEAFLRYARATEAVFLEQVNQVNSNEFLRIDYPGGIEDSKEAIAKVRDGEVYVAKLKILDNGEEIKVRNGIVHHWYGAALVPDVTLDEVLFLVKDYDTHGEVFADVQESDTINGTVDGDVFDIRYRFLKKKLITVVYETEHHVEYTRVGTARAYSMSRTTKVQEVEDPDGRDERKPPDTGRGFMWRINSYWRFEERAEGVWIESESISLTRNIPLLLRPIIGPFVNGVPEDTLTSTLEAVRNHFSESPAPDRPPPPHP